MERQVIQWETPEYYHRPKGADWFWVMGIIGVTGAALAFLFGNALFAILIVLAVFSFMMFGARGPEHVPVMISIKGIRINDALFPFSRIKAFWIEEEPMPQPWLVIHTERAIAPHIRIPIAPGIDPDDVRDFLHDYLEEEHRDITLTDTVADYLGL